MAQIRSPRVRRNVRRTLAIATQLSTAAPTSPVEVIVVTEPAPAR